MTGYCISIYIMGEGDQFLCENDQISAHVENAMIFPTRVAAKKFAKRQHGQLVTVWDRSGRTKPTTLYVEE